MTGETLEVRSSIRGTAATGAATGAATATATATATAKATATATTIALSVSDSHLKSYWTFPPPRLSMFRCQINRSFRRAKTTQTNNFPSIIFSMQST